MTDDTKVPNEPFWDLKTFSFANYADEFDKHISGSIRCYSDLRDDVVGISKYFVEENTQVLDIGCSEGTLIERIADACDNITPVNFIGVELGPAFQKGWSNPKRDFHSYCSVRTKTQEGVSGLVIDPDAPLAIHDIWEKWVGGKSRYGVGKLYLVTTDILDWIGAHQFPMDRWIGPSLDILKPNNLSFVVSLFTMQFLPERYRFQLFKKIYDNLTDGGAFITSEKIFASNAKIQNMMEFLYYDFKKKSFSDEVILDKEKELRHLAKLTTENLLINQLRNVGFRGVQIFWRNFNFIGVLAMKRPSEELKEDNG